MSKYNYENWLKHYKKAYENYTGEKEDTFLVEMKQYPNKLIHVHFPNSIYWYNTHKYDLEEVRKDIMDSYKNKYNDVQFFQILTPGLII